MISLDFPLTYQQDKIYLPSCFHVHTQKSFASCRYVIWNKILKNLIRTLTKVLHLLKYMVICFRC